MSDPDNLLDVLQADMVGILQAVPALSNAYIFTGTEKDFATRLKKTFATRTDSEDGKRGLGIQVLPIVVTEAESNLPGPPLKLRCQILVIENLRLNRATETGTLKTTSQTALNVLVALHLHSVGSHAFYAEKNPIVPEKAEEGFEAHVVTVFARANGLQGPGKVAAVAAEVIAGIGGVATGALIITGITDPDGSDPILVTPTDDHNGYSAWSNVDGWEAQWNDPEWSVFKLNSYGAVSGPSTAESPLEIESWDVVEGAGQPVFTAETEDPGQFLQLACDTFGAAIYYTTDGSYPGAGNAEATLYTAPFALPESGTIIRAAAYSEALNPSDVIEMTVV